MGQQNVKGQLLEQQEEKEDNGNELRELKLKIETLEVRTPNR
jgi:hypothetical protein